MIRAAGTKKINFNAQSPAVAVVQHVERVEAAVSRPKLIANNPVGVPSEIIFGHQHRRVLFRWSNKFDDRVRNCTRSGGYVRLR